MPRSQRMALIVSLILCGVIASLIASSLSRTGDQKLSELISRIGPPDYCSDHFETEDGRKSLGVKSLFASPLARFWNISPWEQDATKRIAIAIWMDDGYMTDIVDGLMDGSVARLDRNWFVSPRPRVTRIVVVRPDGTIAKLVEDEFKYFEFMFEAQADLNGSSIKE